ncbi:NAD-dependent epimerase/dehydratase family protein [Salegentibacter chungangensis]|uniref:NAD-dependent epimerase/dehydratase family protein n=1 Tax=Salegentibacter chungangensis TaxID=1335724 RepID=A0ABW3NNN3_9FLAO
MILVTGGTGLVGSHLLYNLVKSGEKPRAIHRKNSDLQKVKQVFSYYTDKAEEFFKAIEWTEADINDIPALTEAFEGISRVYHCAALVSFNVNDEKKLRKVNIKGTANVVNLCIANSIEKLCYVSSIASLGRPLNGEMVNEDSPWNPEENHSDYAISKYGAEIEVWRGSQEGLKVVIVNPGVIIGPGFWDSGSGLLFKKVDNGLNFHFPKVTGFVSVWDTVEAMRHLMKAGVKNKRYIVVSENIAFKEVLCKTAEALDKPKPKKALKKWMIYMGWLAQKTGSVFGFKQVITRDSAKTLFEETRFDNGKIQEKTGLRFTPIHKVIEKTAEYYKS